MTPDQQIVEIIEGLRQQDQNTVFEVLGKVADELGWELSRRDPGPTIRMLEAWAHLAEQPGAFLEAECGKQEIKESYRHLALQRRVP